MRKKSIRQITEHIVADFVERLGLIAQAEGMPRIAGRIMGLFVMHGGPFSFSELAERLKVSRGSISTNTRLLEQLGVIERMAKPGNRQNYFHIQETPYTHMLTNSIGRLHHAHMVVTKTIDAIPHSWVDARERLEDLSHFYGENIVSMEDLIQRLSPRKNKAGRTR